MTGAGLPFGFSIVLDPRTRRVAPDELLGGSPARVLRLSESGLAALAELETGEIRTPAGARLARRLTDAGVAHPVPPPLSTPADVTVLIPVHNRALDLDRCLTALGSRFPVLVVDDASVDADAVAKVCAEHGATLVRREVNGGPAAARNTGIARIDTPIVAMLDSDCVADPGWIEVLAAHLQDPHVCVVAPRITAAAESRRWAGRYASARGVLDQGSGPALVTPLGRVGFVPSAALVARTELVRFDESMRTGEDVDLVWRLIADGHRVRYVPDVTVTHSEPQQWRVLLRRRFRYGTSAGPLAARHPRNMPPLIVHPWPATAVAGILAGVPALAAVGAVITLARTRAALRKAHVPSRGAARMAAGAITQTWLAAGRYTTQLLAPVVLAGLARRRTRPAAAALLIGPALTNWARSPRALDPLRFVAGHLLDDIVYGAGVWRGAVAARTAVPLLPVTVKRGTK